MSLGCEAAEPVHLSERERTSADLVKLVVYDVKTFPQDSVFGWIRNGRDKPNAIGRASPGWRGNLVSLLIPDTFEAYAKILHRIDARYEDPTSPLSESEIAILKIPPCKRLRGLVEQTRENSEGSRIRWARIAEILEVPIKPEICVQWFITKEPGCWSRFLWGPADGTLRFSEIPFIGTDKPLLFQGSLSELAAFLEPYRFTFEYWWPSDRRWCVCTDYDLMFTLVGGSKHLISRLLASGVLETLEVTPQTRIDSGAPIR